MDLISTFFTSTVKYTPEFDNHIIHGVIYGVNFISEQSYNLLSFTSSIFFKYVAGYVSATHCLKQPAIQKATYSDLRSQMSISVVRTVIGKYKTILENQKEWIEPVFKKPQPMFFEIFEFVFFKGLHGF